MTRLLGPTGALCLSLLVPAAGSASVPIPEQYREDAPDLGKGWSPQLAALGRRLFHEKALSKDRSLSCATCHDPAKAFTDGRPVAIGVGQAVGNRNTPTIINRALGASHFWDGRAKTLEEQALGPMMAPVEMAMDEKLVLERLNADKSYVKEFRRVFGGAPTLDGVAKAIAAYERTVYSVEAPFDRFMAGDAAALSPEAQRGLQLFGGKARCGECHTGVNFTDEDFHVLGVARDPGRAKVTGKKEDEGAYKTPSLREVAKTAPYMHDGSLKTLEEVIDFYDRGGDAQHPNLSPKMTKLNLTPEEKRDLLAFLHALSGKIIEHKP